MTFVELLRCSVDRSLTEMAPLIESSELVIDSVYFIVSAMRDFISLIRIYKVKLISFSAA